MSPSPRTALLSKQHAQLPPLPASNFSWPLCCLTSMRPAPPTPPPPTHTHKCTHSRWNELTNDSSCPTVTWVRQTAKQVMNHQLTNQLPSTQALQWGEMYWPVTPAGPWGWCSVTSAWSAAHTRAVSPLWAAPCVVAPTPSGADVPAPVVLAVTVL